jgi:hemin uptake protein HemP
MSPCANSKVLQGQQADPASSGLASEFIRPAPVSSEELLRGRRLLEIAHNGEVYRLQATRLGKLILTK